MLSSVSGLGRLFNAASSTVSPNTSRGQRQLESVTEEAHTCDLLWPETGVLRSGHHQNFQFRHADPASIAVAANSSDDKGWFNVQHPRDVRIVVGQYLGGNSRLLYDSQPSVISPGAPPSSILNRPANDQNDRAKSSQRYGGIPKSHTAPHSRQSSFSQVASSLFPSPASLSPVNELGSLLGNPRRPNTSDGDNAQATMASEEAKETDALLLSMFGAPGFRAESGTKIHIRPFNLGEMDTSRPLSPGASRTGQSIRRTPLTRSTTAEDLQSMSRNTGLSSATYQGVRRKASSVLITKTFYVDSAEGDVKTQKPGGEGVEPEGQSENGPIDLSQSEKTSQIRTPAFAIGVVIYMPHTQQSLKRSISSRGSPSLGLAQMQHDPSILLQQVSKDFLDQNIEYVMAHWTMIIRAINSVETVIRCELCNQLAQVDVSMPPPSNALSPAGNKSKSRLIRTRSLPRPSVQLPAGALQHVTVIQKAIDATGKRVTSSLQLRAVVIGQERWGIWREEARGVSKWAGGRDQGFFFFSLLTAFLGQQSQWLDSIGPKVLKAAHLRRRHLRRLKEPSVISRRAVIVSLDKMSARRLVFLLAAFLPSGLSDQRRFESAKQELATSGLTASTSPSISGSLSRQQSLRRSLQKPRAPAEWNSHKNHEVAVVDFETATEVSDDRTIVDDGHSGQHGRRASDAVSIRSVALPISSAGRRMRNSSTATTATVNSDCTTPIPHFSTILTDTHIGTPGEWRPGSSGSIASLSLQRTLSRSESNEQSGTSMDSHPSGRWFWGSRRGSSTETSETPMSSGDGLGILGLSKDTRDKKPMNKLVQMVDDAGITPGSHRTIRAGDDPRLLGLNQGRMFDDSAPPSPARDALRPTELEEPFPMDLCVNEEDGVIDVKLPLSGSQSSSLGSIINSPHAGRTLSRSARERFSTDASSLQPQFTPQRTDNQSDTTVGGWLRKFHPDLTLQAVQPYDTLKEEIKQAMRTEPVSSFLRTKTQAQCKDAWLDVSSCLMADASKFTITRVTLSRRHAASPHHQADALLGRSSKENPDEEFREEILTQLDSTLTDSIEKLLATHSGQSSRTACRPPSPPGPTRQSSVPSRDLHSSVFSASKAECRTTVTHTLEQISRGVLAEMLKERSAAGTTDALDRADITNVPTAEKALVVSESSLKDGIRSWFQHYMR